MLIKIGYDIPLRLPFPAAIIYVLRVHPSRKGDLVRSEEFRIEPDLASFQRNGRVMIPIGVVSPIKQVRRVFRISGTEKKKNMMVVR
jgi:hypothetical protein